MAIPRRSTRMATHPAVQAQVADSATRLAWIAGRADAKRDTYTAISDQVWEFAELRFKEVRAAAAQVAALEAEGFTVTSDIAGMPTAFVAEAGCGGPIIGFLGEF